MRRWLPTASLWLAGVCTLAPAAAFAAPGQPKPGFQRPAEERQVDVGVRPDADSTGARGGARSRGPTNELEARHYFRVPPDVVTDQALREEQRQLEVLLKDRETQVDARRDEAIALLSEFVAREPRDSPEMPDALLRLAELRWELSRDDYLVAFERWQEHRKGDPPTPDYAAAMALYDRLIAEHPDYARLDFVLYMKAFALVEQMQDEAAMALFRQILARYPDSPFRPDAYMALAEHVFNTEYDYEKALAGYNRVLEYEDSELYHLALFKGAWCLWRLGRGKEAAVRFRQVLDLDGAHARASGGKRLRELQEEALEYLIQVFTEDERNRAADVRSFLEQIGGERHIERVLRRLSATYYDQARYDRGIEAYALLLAIDPASRHAPDYQLAIARGHMAREEFPEAVQAFDVLARNYGPQTTWASQQTDPEAASDARALGERAIREQAMLLHQRGQDDDQVEPLEQAVALYAVYLSTYDAEPAAYQVAFYRAEILFHRLERYPEAAEAYLQAARMNPQGEFTRDALYNAIGALEHVREAELTGCTQGGEVACPETENDLRFGEAIELYAELYPNDPDLPEILFRQGRLYYERRVYDTAVKLFGELLERYPKSPYAAQAGELILDSFNRAQDYANIESWARRLQKAPAFASAKDQARLSGLILGAVFKIGEQLAGEQKHAEAADAFARAAEEFPKDPRARQALYNAGLERQRAADLEGADRAYSLLIERYPGSAEGARGAWEAAQMYESIALFGSAADFYSAYDAKFPKGDKGADALYNAILLYLAAEQPERAIEAARRFLSRFPRDASADDASFLLGQAFSMQQKPDAAEKTYRAYLKRSKQMDRKVEAYTRLGKAQLAQEQRRAAMASFESAVALARKHRRTLDRGLYFAAEARFAQADDALSQFDAVKIEGSPAGLSGRLRDKAEKLARAATLYSEVVEFGVAEWVTAALFQIGHSYELFAASLNDAPVPDSLNEEEQQVYRDELAMFVVPIEERALDAYAGGYDKALELSIYNSWTHKLYEGLTRLNDIEFPPKREIGVAVVEPDAWPALPVLSGLVQAAPAASGGER